MCACVCVSGSLAFRRCHEASNALSRFPLLCSFFLLKVRRFSISLRKFLSVFFPLLFFATSCMFCSWHVELRSLRAADLVFEIRGSRIAVRFIELHVLSVSSNFTMRQHGGSGISFCLLFWFALISSLELYRRLRELRFVDQEL